MLGDVVSDMRGLPGSSDLRQTIATRAEGTLDDLARLPEAPPDIRIDDAEAYARVGAILSDIDGDPIKSTGTAAILARGERKLRALAGAFPQRADLRLALAKTLVVEAKLANLTKYQRARLDRWLDEANALFDALPPSRDARMER